MSNCDQITIAEPNLLIVIPQQCDFLVEIEREVLVAEFEQCHNQVIEISSPSLAIDFLTRENVIIEIEHEVLIIEFPESVTINNPEQSQQNDITAVVCTFEAGANINVNRVVAVDLDGRIVHADKDDPDTPYDVVGISRQSGSIGQSVEVVKFGRLSGASFGVPSENFFLGNNGTVQQNVSATGSWLSVGVQLTPSDFYVNIGEAIRRN